MPKPIKIYVHYVDAVSNTIGTISMYLVFVMIGILIFAALSRTVFDVPHIWVVEMAEFTMAAYYFLGGAYSMNLKAHVRMDLLYGRWSPKRRAITDAVTSFFLIFYLLVLLFGAISSTEYAIQYGQKNYSSWAPYLAPIKITMTFGVILMLLQAVATFFKDLAKARGETLS